MLSKLDFFRTRDAAQLDRLKGSVDPDLWARHLGVVPGSLRRIAGGTLNLVFVGELKRGGARIFKTHLATKGRAPLIREAKVLDSLYGARCDVQAVVADGRDWLSMTFLQPASLAERQAVDPRWIAGSLDLAARSGQFVSSDVGIADVLHAAETSFDFLRGREEVSPDLAVHVSRILEGLPARVAELPPQPCHGDLGPRNIFSDGAGPMLLDWEDAFEGIAGYDWIYWLSFFDNRALLDRRHLIMSGLPLDLAHSLLVAILLVKCELSVRTGMTLTNSLTTEQRLSNAISSIHRH